MVELRIESLYKSAWKIFGFQHKQLVADRDRFRATLKRRLGHDLATLIQRHVDVSVGHLLVFPGVPNPEIMIMREFYELLAIEKSIEEIKQRIDYNAIFWDPVYELLPTLGLDWRHDVLRLIDGQKSPGHMPHENVTKFLAMVRSATQRVASEGGTEDDDIVEFYRKWRKELDQFLERAVKTGEPLYCDL